MFSFFYHFFNFLLIRFLILLIPWSKNIHLNLMITKSHSNYNSIHIFLLLFSFPGRVRVRTRKETIQYIRICTRTSIRICIQMGFTFVRMCVENSSSNWFEYFESFWSVRTPFAKRTWKRRFCHCTPFSCPFLAN